MLAFAQPSSDLLSKDYTFSQALSNISQVFATLYLVMLTNAFFQENPNKGSGIFLPSVILAGLTLLFGIVWGVTLPVVTTNTFT